MPEPMSDADLELFREQVNRGRIFGVRTKELAALLARLDAAEKERDGLRETVRKTRASLFTISEGTAGCVELLGREIDKDLKRINPAAGV